MTKGLIGIVLLTIFLGFIVGCVMEETKVIEEPIKIPEPEPKQEPTVHTISINELNINPKQINVKIEDIVLWTVNRSFGSRGVAEVMGVKTFKDVRSGELLPGETFSYQFKKPGKYEYLERFRYFPGTIIVEE